MIHLDTHIVVWLYHAEKSRFSAKARKALQERLAISPLVALELQYLFEIGRLTAPARDLLDGLRSAIDLDIASCPLDGLVEGAVGENWTRDPFDRLIVAQARLQGASLITADRRMSQHYAGCIW